MASKQRETRQPFEYRGTDNKHVRIFESMLTSPAFMVLSPNAKLLYLYLKREYKGSYSPGFKVKLPYTDIVKFTGIRKANIKKLLQELSIMGFIEIEQVGGSARLTNVYKLINAWTEITEEQAKENIARLKSACALISQYKPIDSHTTYGKYIRGSNGGPSNKKQAKEQKSPKSIDIITKKRVYEEISDGSNAGPSFTEHLS